MYQFSSHYFKRLDRFAKLATSSMIDIVMDIALQGPIAARRVCVEPTARVHRHVGCLLDRLHREISGRLYNHCPLATDPGDDGRPIFVIMAPTGLVLLTAPTRSAPQRLLATALRLPLVASGMVEVIRFHRACQLAGGFIGDGTI